MTAQRDRQHMRMSVGKAIEPVELTTIDGTRIAFPAADRLTHVQFRRFAGCPVCDLHLQSFVRRRVEIERAGLREIVLFHSSG